MAEKVSVGTIICKIEHRHTRLLQRDRAAAYRELVLVQEAKVDVQYDVFLRFGNRVRCTTNPTQVHRSLVGVDGIDFTPDVGNVKGGVAVGDQGELDINLLHPFLDDDLDFILLNSVPTNENVGKFLFFKLRSTFRNSSILEQE